MFPLLTGISIFCMANNTNPVFRNVFGGASNNEGMGLLSWCLDWNLIGSACLYNPLWLQINQDIGIFLTYILMAGVYYGNLWNAKAFPFMSQAIFVSLAIDTKVPMSNEIMLTLLRLPTALSTTRPPFSRTAALILLHMRNSVLLGSPPPTRST